MNFDSCSPLTGLLFDFINELSFGACDFSFRSSVSFTFERGDGFAQSWTDHILCSKHFTKLVQNVILFILVLVCLPLCFLLQNQSLISTVSPSPLPAKRLCIDWSKASPADIENYSSMHAWCLKIFPHFHLKCVVVLPQIALVIMSSWIRMPSTLSTLCIIMLFIVSLHISPPRRIVGWKDGAAVFKEASNF